MNAGDYGEGDCAILQVDASKWEMKKRDPPSMDYGKFEAQIKWTVKQVSWREFAEWLIKNQPQKRR